MNRTLPFVCVEIPHVKPAFKLIHTFPVSGYREFTSLNAFMHGKRAGKLPGVPSAHDRCCFGPNSLYILKPLLEWETEVCDWVASLDSHKIKPIEYFERVYGTPCDAVHGIPKTPHTSIWAFYQHIQFNYKERHY